MHVRILFALCCLCAIPAPAQAPGPARGEQPAAPRPQGTERTIRGSCSETTSRDLFTSCDADGDDRLDVFEAGEALETVRGPRDVDNFARLDVDRDGFVTWPEFDAALRATLRRGGAFKVRTVRPFAPPVVEARPATPLQKFLQLHDTDNDGGLDPAEVDRYVREAGVPGLGSLLRTLDVDRSGRLEEAELAPWFEKRNGPTKGADGAAGSDLQPPWSAADRDHDGALDAAELAALLRRLDPALGSWAAELLRILDRNHDGRLQPAELPGHRPAAERSTALAPALPRLPLQAPVR